MREALTINPRLVGALVNLGRLANAAGKAAEAEKFWRKALAEDPNCADAWTNLGVFLYWQSRWGESVEVLERAAALMPRSPFVANNLGMAYRVSRLPYGVVLDGEGTVRAKGLINNREQLESLFNAKEMGVASIQGFLDQVKEA